ncbi:MULTISPECIES: hypothetical protein [unclassified Nonomuraea]|uniref:hypothetical protein n=1 Tax=unclassified Nonomuraea TaxID=2593643 RepID=UPI0033E4268F
MSTYLVWSNEHHAYWRPNKSGYTTNWLEAGRYSEEDAAECCSRRTWEPRKPPPEVMILAPDSKQQAFTLAELCAIPGQLQDLIRQATRTAIRERRAQKTEIGS